MVDSILFKKKVEEIVSQNYKVEFLGKDFDKIINSLSDIKTEKIYAWIDDVIRKDVQPIVVSSDKSYRNWRINELLVFRYPLNVNNIEYRILFVKVKNSFFIEFHLGDHKYYDKVRKDLELKKNNYE